MPVPPETIRSSQHHHSTAYDLFGPFIVVLRRSVKRYGIIFDVYLEVSFSMDTDSVLQALRRFVSRRGKPRHRYSDNGINFAGLAKEIETGIRCWNQAAITDRMAADGTEWHFYPPAAAPHFGRV